MLEALGLTGAEDPARLSGGEARRAALARVLAPAPDILLLDEPTNHLDLPAIDWLEAELAALRAALVLISHDRRLLERLSRAVVWLDRGATRRMERGFAGFEAWRDEVLEQEERDAHKLGPQDRRRGGLAALRRHRPAQAQRAAARQPARAARAAPGRAGAAPARVKLEAAEGETSGRIVIEANGRGQKLRRSRHRARA